MTRDRRGDRGDRRDEARSPGRVEVRISTEQSESKGLLVDLSYSGARVEECTWLPPVGSEARLCFEVPGVGKIELSGTVHRYGHGGFALCCDADDLPDRERVDRVTALLFAASTRRGPSESE